MNLEHAPSPLAVPSHTSAGLPYWMASIVLPGWGQLCQARASGLLWLVCGLVAYVTLWPVGLVIHAASVVDAAVWSIRRRVMSRRASASQGL